MLKSGHLDGIVAELVYNSGLFSAFLVPVGGGDAGENCRAGCMKRDREIYNGIPGGRGIALRLKNNGVFVNE